MLLFLKLASLYAGLLAVTASPTEQLVKAANDSGRVVTLANSPDERVSPSPQIAPGQPPMLSFRYYEGKAHHRYNNSDLMLDDAGH
jgi:hypothetical protein